MKAANARLIAYASDTTAYMHCAGNEISSVGSEYEEVAQQWNAERAAFNQAPNSDKPLSAAKAEAIAEQTEPTIRFAACARPARPVVPDGKTASENVMKAANASLMRYFNEVNNYRHCAADEIKSVRAEYVTISEQWASEVAAFKQHTKSF